MWYIMVEQKWTCKVEVESVYDADTVTVVFDLGFNIYYKQSVRIYGIDAAEMRGGNYMTKALAELSKARVVGWLADNASGLRYESVEWQGKYGRAVGNFVNSDGVRLCEMLVSEGLAIPYEGGSRAEHFKLHEEMADTALRDGRLRAYL